MDAVVLAAGRNDRLRGYVPAYLKPLLLFNGEPLIVTLCKNALLAVEGQVIVVVAPQNAAQIIDVLAARFSSERFYFIVQADASGPARALQQGMALVDASELLLLCGDNDVPLDDMCRAVESLQQGGANVVLCCTRLPRESAERFSRLNSTQSALREGPLDPSETGAEQLCWCGPVAARCRQLRAAIQSHPDEPKLSSIFNICGGLDGFVGGSRDLGVPEALT